MVRSSARLLISAATAALMLVGCESQDAAAHREAVEVIEEASRALGESPVIGQGATRHLNDLARNLRGLRGGSKALKASRERMLAQVETRVAELTWQEGLADRVEATKAMAVLEANLHATAVLLARLRTEETLLTQPQTDALIAERVERLQTHDATSAARDRAAPDVSNRQAAIASASAEANVLRQKAADLSAQADQFDGVTGQDLRIEAAGLLRQAAAIDARVDSESSAVELHHQMVLDQLSLQRDHAATGVQVVDEEIERVRQRSEAFRAHAEAGRSSAQSLITTLTDASATVISLLTGPVQENYNATIESLRSAVTAADKAVQSGGRSSREVDTLAAIRGQMGLITIASAHCTRLAEAMRVLESLSEMGESSAGVRWAETRTVLQDNWDEANDTLSQAKDAAAELAGRLGGSVGDAMLSILDAEPPAEN